MRTEIATFGKDVKSVSESSCSSGLYILTFHLLGQLVDSLERCKDLPYTDAKAPDHFKMLINLSYRLRSCRSSTRVNETRENMDRALLNMWRPRKHEGRAKIEEKRMVKLFWLERTSAFSVRDEVQMSADA